MCDENSIQVFVGLNQQWTYLIIPERADSHVAREPVYVAGVPTTPDPTTSAIVS